MRRLQNLLVLVVAVISIFAFTAGSASASGINHHATKTTSKSLTTALCKGSNCYTLDPITEKCWDSSAYITDSTPIYESTNGALGLVIDNWYSPDCNANWNQTYLYGEGINWAGISNANGERVCYSSSGDTCNPFAWFSPSLGSVYTNMVDGSVKAVACVETLAPSGQTQYCGNWS
jgi:hypothetical protein